MGQLLFVQYATSLLLFTLLYVMCMCLCLALTDHTARFVDDRLPAQFTLTDRDKALVVLAPCCTAEYE